ncbi:MAG: hypothetical protein RI973_1554 [Bacteroidota bacterium]|jgi:photosystem II stability/assembly factor-like uncharacterized protein
MNKHTPVLFLLLLPLALLAQPEVPSAMPAALRMQGKAQRQALQERSLVSKIPFRSTGPSVFGGRVADLDVNPADPTHFLVAYASGGLWKTSNNGQSFDPIFDSELVMTIGDIAADWQRNVIWVGTGEVNSSRSSYAGAGLFRSTDGGKTWQHRGLAESHHIGRVVMHPNDPNTLWVAVLGHLYSPSSERGVYKTSDGGENWERVLYVDDTTGAVELLLDPGNPERIFAATWSRTRTAWNFEEAGTGSAIWQSEDAGNTWTRLSTPASGFPSGPGTGRIGLAATQDREGKTRLFAIVDNQNPRPAEKEKDKAGLTREQLRGMSKDGFLALELSSISTFLKDNNFPEKYTATGILDKIRRGDIKPADLVDYLEDANSRLTETEVIGAEVYASDDGGRSWLKTHEGYLDDLYYTYGYYFGQIRVAPGRPDKLYIFGVPVIASDDGGKTWSSIDAANVHGDHHALWISPDRSGHLILGNDGGINISYDGGEHWIKCNTPPAGQFYYVAVDMDKPYNIYGGTQDNGVWFGPGNYSASVEWHGEGQYPWKSLLGGDGMQVAIDSRDNVTVYTGFQFGNYFRLNRNTGKRVGITPKHEVGERPYRWNWQTPIHLSSHNQDILYMGSNKLHRSMNQGDDWQAISGDLTGGGRSGDVPFGTLTAIHESPLKFGLLYAGSDDGALHCSPDGGNTWRDISAGLPRGFWVSRVQASAHVQGRVYVALNGYRFDDFRSLVFSSDDFGASWQPIAGDLPAEPVNVVKEDPVNPNLLYIGTDHGVYVSLDRGQTCMLMNHQLPATPVHDLVVHPRENDLIVGTHGRSVYVADIEQLQSLTDTLLQQPLAMFDIEKTRFRAGWGNKRSTWSEKVSEPDIAFPLYSREAGRAKYTVRAGELVLYSQETDLVAGLNFPRYNGELGEKSVSSYERHLNQQKKKGEEALKLEPGANGKYYLQKGNYQLTVERGRFKVESSFSIE